MITSELAEPNPRVLRRESQIQMPVGLLGFERHKQYLLVAEPDQEPFRWLQAEGDANLAFLVVPPFVVEPDYQPEIGGEDERFLGLTAPGDALMFNIVTLRNGGPATVNLKGPIIINRLTLRAKQVVLVNAADYSLRHPLLLENLDS
jgi:flagellar assembly factor FliW